jgi:hypothetical protein
MYPFCLVCWFFTFGGWLVGWLVDWPQISGNVFASLCFVIVGLRCCCCVCSVGGWWLVVGGGARALLMRWL